MSVSEDGTNDWGRGKREINEIMYRLKVKLNNLIRSKLGSQTKLKFNLHLDTFEFEIVAVNQYKEIIKRNNHSAEYFTEDLSNGLTLEMVAIPSGSFIMGTEEDETEDNDEEIPQHNVNVEAFFIGKYAVTQSQWKAIASLPKVNRDLDPDPSYFKGENLPVESIDWNDAVEFCQRLSKHTGKKYRLPSEAEWEYACRAGTTTPFHFGDTITRELANYEDSFIAPIGENRTTPIGSFSPNAFGLYDMHGNVWEWCEDDWHDNYEGAPTDGSAWSQKNIIIKVIRGGSWISTPENCRSAYRHSLTRADRYNNLGFRVVCVVPKTT